MSDMSNHDPLCPALYPNVNGWCMCVFIAQVRADEREKAAQRVHGVQFWHDGDLEPRSVVHRWTAIAAARGEAT